MLKVYEFGYKSGDLDVIPHWKYYHVASLTPGLKSKHGV